MARLNRYATSGASGFLSKPLWDDFSPESVISGQRRGIWYLNDFTSQHPDVNQTDNLSGWTTTLVEAGAGGDSTITYNDAHGGEMVLTTDNADYDGLNLQHGGGEYIDLDSVDWFGMEWRYKVSDADTISFFGGLTTTDTTILASSSAHAITVAQRVGVYHLDTSAALLYTHDNNTTDTEGTLATLADATYVKIGFDVVPSRGEVNWYVNGTLTHSESGLTLVGTEVRPSIALRTGSTAAKTATFDWVAFGGYFNE